MLLPSINQSCGETCTGPLICFSRWLVAHNIRAPGYAYTMYPTLRFYLESLILVYSSVRDINDDESYRVLRRALIHRVSYNHTPCLYRPAVCISHPTYSAVCIVDWLINYFVFSCKYDTIQLHSIRQLFFKIIN